MNAIHGEYSHAVNTANVHVYNLKAKANCFCLQIAYNILIFPLPLRMLQCNDCQLVSWRFCSTNPLICLRAQLRFVPTDFCYYRITYRAFRATSEKQISTLRLVCSNKSVGDLFISREIMRFVRISIKDAFLYNRTILMFFDY